jgi:hypothetical protein
VLEQHEAPTRTEHPPHLGHGGAIVRDRAQRQRAHHRVKRGVLELERLRVPQPQLDRPTQLDSAPAGNVEHRGHEVDSRESDAIGVVGKVASRSHGNLQHITLGLGADPLAATGEQQPFRELDVAVVVARLPLIDTADSLGLLESWGHDRR